MAVRARAAAAMAAPDRRASVPDELLGQSWSRWPDRTVTPAADGSSTEECSKILKKRMETMTLRKEDMAIYGHRPAYDDFFLVVCSHCGQVVKPQAFEKHCERRHGLFAKLHSPSAHSGPPQQPCVGRSPVQHRDGKQAAMHRLAKAQKETFSFSPVDNLSQAPPPSPPCSSAPSPRDPPWPHGTVQPTLPSQCEKSLQKGIQGPPVDVLSPLRGPRTYSRTYKKVPPKECDLDKHCGVLDPERKKQCTRLLTCNIHSIHQRRQVAGRSKNFDQLIAELKMGAKARERVPFPKDSLQGPSPCSETAGVQTGNPPTKRQPNNCLPLRSGTPSESGVEMNEMEHSEKVEASSQQATGHSHLSSDDSEGEGHEELMDLPSRPWHPQPLGLCTFSSGVLGCGVFTFDRRLHRLRFALSAMVEQHLSAHLWKKIPQLAEVRSNQAPVAASSGLRSHNSSGSASGRASAHSSVSSSSSSSSSSSLRTSVCFIPQHTGRENSSSGQPATKGSRTAPGSGPGRPRNPAGRPSKQQLRLQEQEQSVRTEGQGEETSDDQSIWSRSHTLSDRMAASFAHGPINGTLSPGKKPRPLLHVVESQPPSPVKRASVPSASRAAAPPTDTSSPAAAAAEGSGLLKRALSYDHKGLSKRRKTSGASPSSTPARPQKSHALSSPTRPNFFSWKKASKIGGGSLGLEKKPKTQKPKLHH
ncbi:ataxin-7-like protein 2 isoform X2 [Denticeps clupeoides]|uniref:ataxin-7-like protein 2 isoform X2 n=1 Tax=Denticeps clupeoides TaxID=299321 RepID=UPI0010A56031|nr:ataxin-7-like protein 2 isoform X2 [Denticeps clupeoides]